jgi:hypothetical protein
MRGSTASSVADVSLSWYSSAPSDLQALDDDVQNAAIRGLVDLLGDPFIGEELRYLRGLGDLSACRKLYIDVPPDKRVPGPSRYRIVYWLLPNSDQPTTVQINLSRTARRRDRLSARCCAARTAPVPSVRSVRARRGDRPSRPGAAITNRHRRLWHGPCDGDPSRAQPVRSSGPRPRKGEASRDSIHRPRHAQSPSLDTHEHPGGCRSIPQTRPLVHWDHGAGQRCAP